MSADRVTYTHDEWRAEAVRRFGEDVRQFRFVCPVCGHVASVQDYLDAKAPQGAIGFSCIGRYLPTRRDAFTGEGSGPCNYTCGGLFQLGPVTVNYPDGKSSPAFAFAEATP